MWFKRMTCMFLLCVLVVGVVAIPVNAVEVEETEVFHVSLAVPRASGSFNMTISANSTVAANSGFPLEAGETVTIKASYSPFSASVDVGLVDPDGNFHFVNITNGSIDETIQVNESGTYTLQFRNNSNKDVKVSGFVKY